MPQSYLRMEEFLSFNFVLRNLGTRYMGKRCLRGRSVLAMVWPSILDGIWAELHLIVGISSPSSGACVEWLVWATILFGDRMRGMAYVYYIALLMEISKVSRYDGSCGR
jgi:hypothetical protein